MVTVGTQILGLLLLPQAWRLVRLLQLGLLMVALRRLGISKQDCRETGDPLRLVISPLRGWHCGVDQSALWKRRRERRLQLSLL